MHFDHINPLSYPGASPLACPPPNLVSSSFLKKVTHESLRCSQYMQWCDVIYWGTHNLLVAISPKKTGPAPNSLVQGPIKSCTELAPPMSAVSQNVQKMARHRVPPHPALIVSFLPLSGCSLSLGRVPCVLMAETHGYLFSVL